MLTRLVVAAVIGVVVFLVCLLLGSVLVSLHVPVLTTIGNFLVDWDVVIGVLAAILAFFTGWSPIGVRP